MTSTHNNTKVQARAIHIKNQLKTAPVALTGLSLGIAGISGALGSIFSSYIPLIGIIISSFLLFIIFIKNILHSGTFIEELSHPVLGSFIPTFTMSLMVISSVLAPYTPNISVTLWLSATIVHAFLLIQFIRYRIQQFTFEHVVPSWFVPAVGIVVACTTSPSMGFDKLAQGIFYFGLIAYCILLPIILYRVLFGTPLTQAQLPTFAIIGAPANLCLLAFLTIFPQPNPHIVHFLLYLALFTTFLVYIFCVRIVQLPFSPAWSSLTFPLAVGANAMLRYYQYLKESTTVASTLLIWKNIAYIELAFASIVITYVFIRVMFFLYKHFSL